MLSSFASVCTLKESEVCFSFLCCFLKVLGYWEYASEALG